MTILFKFRYNGAKELIRSIFYSSLIVVILLASVEFPQEINVTC